MGGGVGGRAGGGPDGVKGDSCDKGYALLTASLPPAAAEADTPAPLLWTTGVQGAAAAAAVTPVAAEDAIVGK